MKILSRFWLIRLEFFARKVLNIPQDGKPGAFAMGQDVIFTNFGICQIFFSWIAGAVLLAGEGGVMIDFSPGTISWTCGGSGAGAGLPEQPAIMKTNKKQEKNIRSMKKTPLPKND